MFASLAIFVHMATLLRRFEWAMCSMQCKYGACIANGYVSVYDSVCALCATDNPMSI